jgi:DNA-binding response OmpR family regulator
MLATDFLEDAGFKVDTAGTAREALNKLALVPGGFAAVIVDIGLPDRSGDDLVREIRSMHASVPIIVATGKGAKEVREAIRDLTHVAVLGKPYLAEDLYRALRALHVAVRHQSG